ncbi:hypothetical protein QQF64_006835, partial [Cirrhinus molitorella]
IILENPMQLYRVTVEVTDINDNAPMFSKSEMRFEINEMSLAGARFILERAIDHDVGRNGLQSYSLEPTDNFVLKFQNLPDGNKAVEMVLQTPLDREKKDHISLLLTAFDGGEPQMSGTIKIHITVLDANDNAPVCSQSVYKTSIPENSPKGTVLTTVSASDADQGSNGRISFFISSTADKAGEIFEIDPDAGVVKLIGGIDYEISKYYQIDVQARDEGGHTDSCKIIVDVIDTNDNNPTINIISKSSQISEDSKSGTVLAILNIQDVDSNESGKVNCHLNENVPFIIQSSPDGFYSLVTDSNLDRERESEYNISVTCTDEGVPSLSSSVTLSLQISDVNDNAPVFDKSFYQASVQENNTPGLSIFTVRARDADFNQNARVSYILEDSLVNGVPVFSLVSVSADSGVIHAVRSFDYEQIKDFQFRIKAQDGGSPPLSSNVSVKITIQDQNDNAPQVLYPVHSALGQVSYSVPEEMAKGSLVGNIAQDLGLDLKRLKSGKARIYTGDSAEYIELSKERGVLLIKEKIDRETLCGQTTPCALHFQITLENPMEFYSITVAIVDVNDNAPVFPVKEIKFDISESSPTGAKFVLETAVDDDVGFNSVQTYSLHPADYFILKTQDMPDGSKNVEMILQKPLDREKQEHISLLLTAVDGGDPQMSGTIPIIITIEDANDNAPACFLPVYKTSVAENSPKGTVLTTVQASDADQGQNGKIEYHISKFSGGTTNLFEIDRNEGVLRLSGDIDYERVKHYQIDVQARDPGRHSDTCKVIVDVVDVNDNKPVINIMSKSNTLSEDSKPDTVVTMLNVQDSDSGENGK